MKNAFRKGSFLIFPTALLMLFLSGCETVKGVGRDIEGASTSIQKSMSGGSSSRGGGR